MLSLVLPPETLPGSRSECWKKNPLIPPCFWQGERKSDHFEICREFCSS